MTPVAVARLCVAALCCSIASGFPSQRAVADASATAFANACGADSTGLFAPLDQKVATGTTYGVLRFTVRHVRRKADEIVVLIKRRAGDVFAEYDPVDQSVLHDVAGVSCSFKPADDIANVALGNARCPRTGAPTVVDRGEEARIVAVELTTTGLHVVYRASSVSLSVVEVVALRHTPFAISVDGVMTTQFVNGRAPQLVTLSLPTASHPHVLVVGGLDGKTFVPTSRICW